MSNDPLRHLPPLADGVDRRYPLSQPWSADHFLRYVLSHASEKRALFSPGQLDRLCDLAGVAHPLVPEELVGGFRYPVLSPEMAAFLVGRARIRAAVAEGK